MPRSNLLHCLRVFATVATLVSAAGLNGNENACDGGAVDCEANSAVAKSGRAMLQKRGVMRENIATDAVEADSTPTSCTANNKYNSQQVSVCGCGSKRFPAGSTFLLNGKSLEVASSFRSACSKACGKEYCATVNLAEKVGSGFSWKAEDLITFPETEEEPVADCTANNKYNSQQVSVCGCGSKKFPEGSTFLLKGKSLTVASSFRSACSKACGKEYCATVNLAEKVGSGFSWASGDPITLDKTPASDAATVAATEAPPKLTCEKYCKTAKAGWKAKCQWSDCNGCSDCTVETGSCMGWCSTDPKGWSEKCKTYTKCAQCEECVSFLQMPVAKRENITSDAVEAESTPTSCTANNKYNSQQVSVCGCGSKRFPAGSTFLLNGKSLEVASSFRSACSKACGKEYCATVNLAEKVGSGFSWKAEDLITFPETEEEPVADCTANKKYNSQQVSVCGCGSKKFPEGSTFLLKGKSLTVASSFRSACSKACGKEYCATVNLAEKVGSGFSWASGDPITLDKTPASDAATVATTEAPPKLTCEKYCKTAKAGWKAKCQWSDCNGCSDCTVETGSCMGWCSTDPKGWSEKCKTYTKCAQCEECESFS